MTTLDLPTLSLIAFIVFAVFVALVIEWTGWGATRRKLRAIRRRSSMELRTTGGTYRMAVNGSGVSRKLMTVWRENPTNATFVHRKETPVKSESVTPRHTGDTNAAAATRLTHTGDVGGINPYMPNRTASQPIQTED